MMSIDILPLRLGNYLYNFPIRGIDYTYVNTTCFHHVQAYMGKMGLG